MPHIFSSCPKFFRRFPFHLKEGETIEREKGSDVVISNNNNIKKYAKTDGIVVTTKALADMFGISTKRIMQHTDEGILEKVGRGSYDLTKSVLAYVTHLKTRTGAANDSKTLETQKLTEDMMLKRAKREKAEMELKLYKGELHKANDVEQLYTGIILNAKAKLDAIPSKLAPKLINIEDVNYIFELLQNEVLRAEDELAEYDVTAFLDEEVVKHGTG